jgi:hypothetical protein
MSQLLTQQGLVIALCPLFLAGLAFAQTVVRSFNGDSGPGLATCQSGATHCDRPEMDVAANSKQVVQVTWQNVRVYNKTGRLLQSTPMTAFIRNAGLNPVSGSKRAPNSSVDPGPIEPHIVYDEFIKRWIITITAQNDSLMVSASPDPRGKWSGVYPSCLQGGPCLNIDAAIHLGYDKNGIYFCAVHIGDENPHTLKGISYDCFAIPSSEAQAVGQGIAPQHINRGHNLPLDDFPAIDHNRSKPADAPAFFAAKSCDRITPGGCQNSKNFPFHWIVDTFTWNGAAGKYNVNGEQEIKTGTGSTEDKWLYNKPCCAPAGGLPQAGDSANTLRVTESHRLTNLVQYGSHLYTILPSGPCTSDCGLQGTDANNVAFWVDLNCSNPAACVVSQTAKISGADFNPEFPTVGVDAMGNVGIVADSTTAKTDFSILLWTHRKNDPPNTFKGPVIVVSGTQPYTCLNTRNTVTIGNAVGVLTALDQLHGASMWTTEQWANDATPCVWNTRIVQYRIDSVQARLTGHPPL